MDQMDSSQRMNKLPLRGAEDENKNQIAKNQEAQVTLYLATRGK